MADRLNLGGRSTTSVDTVLQNNDLLSEILLKLPLKALFKCKCVSKKWKHMVSNPIFEDIHKNKTENASLPLLGLFEITSSSLWNNSRRDYFVSTCDQGRAIRNRSFRKIHAKFLCDSSRGLILIGGPNTYYVCNPITNQTLKLPIGIWDYDRVETGLSCEKLSSNGVIHFKVVRVKKEFADKLEIHTFSSRTKKWSELNLCMPFQNKGKMWIKRCDVIDGVIIWRAHLNEDCNKSISLIAYDPHMTNGRIWIIKFPEDNILFKYLLSRSPDGLLQFARHDPEGLNIFVLSKKLTQYCYSETIGTEEWVLKHKVLHTKMTFTRVDSRIDLLAIHPWDSNIVYLHIDSTIVRYNFKSGEVKAVEYDCDTPLIFSYSWAPFFQPSWPYALPF